MARTEMLYRPFSCGDVVGERMDALPSRCCSGMCARVVTTHGIIDRSVARPREPVVVQRELPKPAAKSASVVP